MLLDLARICEVLSGCVRSSQRVQWFPFVTLFSCLLIILCCKDQSKAIDLLVKSVRLDIAMWNLEARLQKTGGIGLGAMLKAESCVEFTSHEKMSLPKVRTIMHLDSFENFTFQLWPMHLAQSCYRMSNSETV